MSISFDGAFTPWRSVGASAPAWGGPAFTQAALANSYSADIQEQFRDMQREAKTVAASAETFIENCIAFSTSPVTITYTPPGFVSPVFTAYPTDASLDVEVDEPDENIDPPDSITVTDQFQFRPPGGSPVPPSPILEPEFVNIVPQATQPQYEPEDYKFSAGDPPELNPPEGGDGGQDPPLPPGTGGDCCNGGTFVTPKPYELPEGIDEGLDDITTAKDNLKEFLDDFPEPQEYEKVFDAVFGAVGALQNDLPFGTTTVTAAKSIENRSAQKLLDRSDSLWPGMTLPEAATNVHSIWKGNESARYGRQRSDRVTAATARTKTDALPMAFQIGARAHSVAIDIEISVIKQELLYISALTESMGAWYDAVTGIYSSTLALFKANAEVFEASYVEESVAVAQYSIDAEREMLKGDINQARASLFAAREGVKGSEMAGFKAQLQGERAKIEAFDASKAANVGGTAELEAKLTEFKATCEEWRGNAMNLATQYKAALGKIQSVTAKNQALVETESAKGAYYSADTALIASEVAEASKVFQELQRHFAAKGLDYAETTAQNAVEGYLAKKSGFEFSRELQELAATLNIEAGQREGAVTFNNNLVTYLKTVSDAAYRAASQTQQANNQLVTAYANAQKAAGDAQAALESGKWSGWNVTATAKAVGTLQGNTQYGRQIQENKTVNITESDTATQEV